MDHSVPPPVVVKHLRDYRPPDWLVPAVRLEFALDADRTIVRARLEVQRNGTHDRPLILDCEDMSLLSTAIDGTEQQPLPGAGQVELAIPGASAVVETIVAIAPAGNSRLMGLYASGGNLCTQCEAEGFRRITPWPDRPDVLSRFSVRLEADATAYPVLLANGNLVASGPLDGGRHFAEWDDPFPKPSYLFALVAGTLAAHTDRFRTRSGRDVALAILVAPDDVARTAHAMESLKQAMAWDEQMYGREYDLDRFNIVAVHDFNFGAMENKGLNIFNAKYILADPDTATDWDFDAIAAVVAHEYFHNWSGNRVTCRDWFQLCLKEGFTVYRDQCFSESLGSAAVRRIEQVRGLRAGQFPEDDGPLAHPVRPQSYQEISNFYTATVYNKGAEIVRMAARLLGPQRFRRATDRYFETNDGKAATVEDFLAALAPEGLDPALFQRWYDQAGTPRLDVRVVHDPATRSAVVNLEQSQPRAGPDALPLPLPVALALFDRSGQLLAEREQLLCEPAAAWHFDDIPSPPVVSANRGFAAPLIPTPPPPRPDLALLARVEPDALARYDAVQQLMLSAVTDSIAAGGPVGHADVVAAVAAVLERWDEDPALAAETVLVPSEALIAEQMPAFDPVATHDARNVLRRAIAGQLRAPLQAIRAIAAPHGTDLSGRAKGLRRLRAVALGLLMADDGVDAAAEALASYHAATSMTERMGALVPLASSMHRARAEALSDFEQRYATWPEVIDKWFQVQAGSARADTLETVARLAGHPAFDRRNPNRLRALLLTFGNNPVRLHDRDGAGYRFIASEAVAVDRFNPQSAARLIQPLTRWARMAEPWQGLMRAALADVAAVPGLSRDMVEVVGNGLK
jgi:aminopeptidase N